MKYWSPLFICSLLFGAASANSAVSSDCISTHLLPVITTSASALILTDLMPEATSVSNKLPEPHSESAPGAVNTQKTSPVSVEPIVHGGIPTMSGEGSGKPATAASTPSSSTHPVHVSGASNEGTSKTGRAAFAALALALIIQSAGSM
ncbi:uncharacterized protein FSUBG_13935 [Fusarium subglutinans]|uniref:Uncharacterized protein n=1 Tax=Gibberella subglutinans TaxID=42677 RepID=A0A8H5NSF9_GIBSU|nr:uncharacterized protein FSUBG_13935 [Fusarium subglutinans]KAF5575273.1 hypothetical protein FSUBG_13935 [Fusarium subglutinans]